jgi:TolB-like protein/DNA-binding winged helix-turn-helix (wHTH) protein
MAAPQSSLRRLRFGIFLVDIPARELYRKNSRIKIQNQVFQVLALLLERPGEVVTREELQKALWPRDTFVDFDEGLNASIGKLRATLGDSADNPRFVETVPRVGYRFIAPVAAVEEAEAESHSERPPTEPSTKKGTRRLPLRVRWMIATGAVLIMVAVGLALNLAGLRDQLMPSDGARRTAPPPKIESIAVLPLENLSGDPTQEYFSDGLTDELITDLAELTHQRIISRTSVMHYKKTTEPAPQIARELGVDAIVEGTVERAGDRVRIRAQLVLARSDQQLWAASYDRDLRDVLLLQTEVAQKIADEIQVALGHKRGAPPALAAGRLANYEAYDQYLKGRYFWNQRTPEGFEKAIACFQKAIKDDPDLAEAHSGLADSYAMMSGYGLVSPDQYMPKARAAALRALEIDPSLAEAHTSLAIVAENYDWDWKTADKEFRRAIELNPSYATARQWYAEYLVFAGRFDEAVAESDRARQLDPLSLIIATDGGAVLYFSRRYDRAIERFRGVLDIDPEFPRTPLIMGAYVEKGRYKDALEEIQRRRRAVGNLPWTWSWEAYVYGRAGEPVKARRALEELKRTIPGMRGDPVPLLGFAYAGMNDRENSLAMLQKACLEHSNILTSLKVDPAYDFLRGDPRFQDLLRKVGLAP